VTNRTIEYMKPVGVSPNIDVIEYRNWRKQQIVLQRNQLVDRIQKFDDKINKFREKKH
jgi:hypothetical protein